MPIFKVPIVHKFGIISQSQRVELQKQILDQAHRKDTKSFSKLNVNPFQVSEEFVQKYNAAGLEEKEELNCKVEQLLCRSKRRCGLLSSGEGNHVDLPLGWSELAILAQCKGKLQSDCLDVLCTSLNEAPLHKDNIPTLFFLAENSLYWLHADAMNQPYLRSTEIKLFKMGQLVFIRLLFHLLCGHLHGMSDLKVRLSSYMDAIKDRKSMYSAYPAILLCFEVIIAAGEQVVGPYLDSNQTTGHVVERSENVPALAACVYRALNVWKVVVVNKVGVKKAIQEMTEVVPEISHLKDWLSGFMAISILGEAAKTNLQVCKYLQSLACGLKLPSTHEAVSLPNNINCNSPPLTRSLNEKSFERRSETGTGEKKSFNAFSRSDTSTPRLYSGQRNRNQSGSDPINTGQGSEVGQTGQRFSNLEYSLDGSASAMGIRNWSWKNAYQYSVVLTDICLFGSNSEIQKTALMGKWGDADVTTFRAGIANPCIESSGLADLLEFGYVKRGTTEMSPDWSWMVRYGALFGLNKLAHSLSGSKEKSGFRSAAWSLITSMQDCGTTEERILEALPISQIESFNSPHSKATNIWARIAQQLSDVYIPTQEFRPPSSLSKSRRKLSSRQTTPKPSVSYPNTKNVRRPTLGEELLIHTAAPKIPAMFNARTSMDLQRVVSDQWRKELLQRQQSQETAKLDALLLQRKKEEENEKKVLERRKEKLKGKPTAMLGPYEVLK